MNNTDVGIVRTWNKGAERLYYFIYDGDGPRLGRKYEKYTDIMRRRADITYSYTGEKSVRRYIPYWRSEAGSHA
jgi:hypothetical protein